jgi:mRNA interferase RelE/StbE
MAYRLLYLPGVAKDLRDLPEKVRGRVRHGLDYLADEPRAGKPLHGELAPFWSYRVGDYRIVYEIRRGELVILVVMIGQRRAVYEKARRRI